MLKYFTLLIFLSSCTFAKQLFVERQGFAETFDLAGTKKGATLGKKTTAKAKKEKKAPLSVDVAQAFFDQEKLNIKIILSTHTEVDPSQIVLGVSGLSDGELVEETYKKLSDVVAGDLLEADSKIAVRFELTQKDLTEYQVRCSWGNEAKDLWAKLTPAEQKQEPQDARASLATSKDNLNLPALSGKLELSNLDIQSEQLQCVLPPCDLSYTVVGKFYNGTENVAQKAKLAVGLYWANDGQVPQIPDSNEQVNENEEVVEVALGLQSRETATIRVKLDRSVPQVPGGSFIPHVRLISEE